MSFNLADINTVKPLLARHGFTFSKALGQNFLINPDVCPKMARAALKNDCDGVIEIGAGVGVLTTELCKKAKKVVSLEIDKRLLPVLSETLAEFDNVEIVNADILKTDLAELIKDKMSECESVCICANLPYYITSPVIMRLLESTAEIKRIVVMVQKEAADRLTAAVGSRSSGAITVAVNYYAEAQLLFDVGKNSFTPPPKVDSSVIMLTPKAEKGKQGVDEELFFRLVRAIFMQRRKTALNGISAGLGIPKESVKTAMERAGIDPAIRAEKLNMEELFTLTEETAKVI